LPRTTGLKYDGRSGRCFKRVRPFLLEIRPPLPNGPLVLPGPAYARCAPSFPKNKLDNDPSEKTDLAATHPDVCQQLVAGCRPPEKHLNIPDKPLLVLGEKENAHPPAWLQPYLDSLPGAPKSKKK
jgi:hypothetical protein